MTAAQSAGTTRFAIVFQFLTMAARSMVRRPPVSSAGGPEASVCADSSDAGARAAGSAAGGGSCEGLETTLATTAARSGTGEPAPPADAFAEAGGAPLNFALHLPNAKGASPSFQCRFPDCPAGPSYGGSYGGCNG